MNQNPTRSKLRHRRNSILATAIAPVALAVLSFPTSTSADAIFVPTDTIRGGQLNLGAMQFQVGFAGTAGGVNNWPTNESPDHAIDGVGQKYLNFAEFNTGILVRPAFNGGNGSVVTSMQLWVANDQPPRDPASYEIWGSNATLDLGIGTIDFSSFLQISTGGLALPPVDRNMGGLNPLLVSNSQTVTFDNTLAYKTYVIVFPTVRDSASANSMQIAEIQLFGVASFTGLIWTGNTSSIWDIGTTLNWDNSGTPSTFADTNGVTFNDTVTPGRSNITIQAGGVGVKPAVVIFQNNTVNYSLSGDPIDSPGSMTLNGTGTVTLNNSNNFVGGVVVNAGNLVLGAGGSVGLSPLRVNNPNTGPGSAVNVTFNSAATIGSLSGTIGVPASGTNTATLQLNGDLTVTQSATGVFAGSIAGTGGLIKVGAGVLALTGGSTFAGPTTVTAGTLNLSRVGNPEGALPSGRAVTVNSGATLLLGADDALGVFTGRVSSVTVAGGTVTGGANTRSALPQLVLNGGKVTAVDAGGLINGVQTNYVLDGDVSTIAGPAPSSISSQRILLRKDPTNTGTSAPVTFLVPRGTAPVDLEISAQVQDLGSGLIKSGNGILALVNSNLYTGPTALTAGTILVSSPTALGTGPVTISDGATLAMQTATSLSGFSGFTLNGGATVDPTNTVLTLTENIGSLARSAFFPAPINYASGFTTSFTYTAGGNRAADGFTFTLQNSSPTALGGGGGALGYVGIPASVSLQFNIYTGAGQPIGTNVAFGSSGVYIASAPVNLASGNPINITVTYDPAAQTLSETLFETNAGNTYTNVFTGISIPAFVGSNTAYVGFTGATGGAIASQTIGGFSCANVSNQLVLPNAIQVSDGATSTIDILPNSGGTTASTTVNGPTSIGAGGTLNVTGGATATNAPFELILTGTMSLNGNGTINVGTNGTGAGNVVILAPIQESIASNLTKAGGGILTIEGAATYQGITTVNAGTLLVQGSLSGATTTVNNSGILGGNGTLTGVSVATGGTLSPGIGGVGTLFTGPLSLLGGSTFALDFGSTTSDRVQVAGAGTLAGTVALNLTLTADPTDFQSFTVLDGSAPLIGYAVGARFSYLGQNLAEGQVFVVTTGPLSQEFMISYAGGGGNDVTLTAVPEPPGAAFVLLGLGLTLVSRRRNAAV